MAPLAPKPPFATDKPDSFYAQPQPRLRQPPPPDPNQRTSAYNLYDNYLGGDDDNQLQPSPDRNSGVGALGMGLLNMEDSDSEIDDDDDIQRPPGLRSGSLSKQTVLAATTASLSPTRPNFPPVKQQQPQQLPTAQAPSSQPSVKAQVPSQFHNPLPPSLQSAANQHIPQPIAAPRPGYAAPIAALNLARAEPSATPVGRMPNQSQFNNPFAEPLTQHAMPASPAPSTPHLLHPSVTPITPAFIRPSKSPAPAAINIKFSEAIPRKLIMRGNTEETLLPGRGEKGDDFWRRFSMVAKEGSGRKESSWLHKMRNRSNRQTRAVWFTAILIIILIAGGVVLGLFLSRKAPSNQQPEALGGSADSLATSTSSSSAVSTKASAPAQSSQTSFYVTPTFTLNNREPEPSPLAVRLANHFGMNAARRLD